MENEPVAAKSLPTDLRLDIARGIVFSILTCGLYNIYWNAQQFKAMNLLLGREEYNFWLWLLLSIVTCGIFHIYYEYKMGVDLTALLKERGVADVQNFGLIGLVVSFFGLTVVADAIYQNEFNRLAQ